MQRRKHALPFRWGDKRAQAATDQGRGMQRGRARLPRVHEGDEGSECREHDHVVEKLEAAALDDGHVAEHTHESRLGTHLLGLSVHPLNCIRQRHPSPRPRAR